MRTGAGAGTGTGMERGRERERRWRRTRERKMGTGTGTGTGSGWRALDDYRMGTRTGVGAETKAIVEMGMRARMGTGTKIESGRAEERRRSARSRTRVADDMGIGGDLVRKREKRRKERVGPVAAKPDNLEYNKKAGGEHEVHRAKVTTVQVEIVCLLCRV